jgi:UDP-glucose 4-epimerase
MNKIIVTGAAGYIGGQVSIALRDAGHQVIGIDLESAPAHLVTQFTRFHQTDFASDTALQTILEHRPDAIIHCAGTSLVGPSIDNPQEYYNNNVVKTLKLLDLVVNKLSSTRFIFSSSAAVYGVPFMTPCHEVDPCDPISPYGESKLMIEQAMASYHRAYDLNYVAFRYFNACGADSTRRHGQAPGATHIIARVLESIKNNEEFTLNGIDYQTRDGTCIRDYVHVEDIARAHVLALDSKIPSGVYNLGSNTGVSNREIITAAEAVTSKTVNVVTGPAREGDPPVLTAEPSKFTEVAGEWKKYTLTDTMQHAWNWYNV